MEAVGRETNTPVHDTDNTIVLLEDDDDDPSACVSINASPSSAQTSLVTTLTCTGTQNANTFRIEVRNPSGVIVNTINSASGQVTLPLIG